MFLRPGISPLRRSLRVGSRCRRLGLNRVIALEHEIRDRGLRLDEEPKVGPLELPIRESYIEKEPQRIASLLEEEHEPTGVD